MQSIEIKTLIQYFKGRMGVNVCTRLVTTDEMPALVSAVIEKAAHSAVGLEAHYRSSYRVHHLPE